MYIIFVRLLKILIKVNDDENIWRRDCYTPEDGFVGCKNDNRSNGTMHWDIEICVCEGDLCNVKMGDITTSSTESTTTHEGILFIIF